LAFSYSRRICRLSLSIFQPTVYSRRTSIFISFLSIVTLLSSVAAVQQQVVNHQPQRTPPYITAINETITIYNPSRRRMQPTTPVISSTIYNELLNKTNISQEEQQHHARSPAHLVIIIIICSIMCCLTVLGNLVVILTVCLVRKLQTASNILIVSLAVSDILVGLFIMPLAMGKVIHNFFIIYCFFLVLEITSNNWLLGSVMCDIWTSTDVLLCTSSILNFLVISIDRYCIINYPFKYAPMRKVKLLSLMIAGVWILSALVSLPPILGWGRMYPIFIF
jgi:hypothetical protein